MRWAYQAAADAFALTPGCRPRPQPSSHSRYDGSPAASQTWPGRTARSAARRGLAGPVPLRDARHQRQPQQVVMNNPPASPVLPDMRIHRPNGLPGAPAGREDHTTNILAKLQVTNRSEAGAIARDHGKAPADGEVTAANDRSGRGTAG